MRFFAENWHYKIRGQGHKKKCHYYIFYFSKDLHKSFQVIVLQVGANNHGDSAEEIAEGIKTICNLINDKQPQAFLVVLTLLPRGYSPNSLRDRNSQVNTLVADQLKGNSR